MNHTKIDFSEKCFPIGFDAPINLLYDRDTGALAFEAVQMHDQTTTGIRFRAQLSPAATRQLLLGLKEIEQQMGMPLEDLAKPNSFQ